MTLLEILRMLRDKDGWRLARQDNNLLDDEAAYRDTGIYVYLDCGGARFRKYDDGGWHEDKVVYMPNLFVLPIISIFVGILRRYLVRKEMSK